MTGPLLRYLSKSQVDKFYLFRISEMNHRLVAVSGS